MSYLVDTNVVSEFRRTRPHGAVMAWLEPIPASDLYLSAVTIGEIQAGIEITRSQDVPKAVEIETFLDQLVTAWNIVSMDASTFRRWARLMHGRPAAISEDAMIAATALVHNLTVATRNTRDFAQFGVRTVDPFAYKPA